MPAWARTEISGPIILPVVGGVQKMDGPNSIDARMIRRAGVPAPALRVPRDAWDQAPWNRWSFQHVREILPTAEVWRGDGKVADFVRRHQDIDRVEYRFDGKAGTVAGFLDNQFTDGFIVLHRGTILFERYLNGMNARSLHLSQSVGKSLTGALCGILAARGLIDPSAPITDYLPELAVTAYAGASVQHVLDMQSGVVFNEEYTDRYSHMGKCDYASGWRPKPDDVTEAWPGSIWELILELKEKRAEHGAGFQYRSIETDVIAFALERVSGLRLPELMSRELWSRLGVEESANFTVDAEGYALADGGFNATLRDYARFGQMILQHGFFNESQIVPAEWVAATRRGEHDKFTGIYRETLPNGAYCRQFWIEDWRTGTLICRGVFGQLIYIDFAHDFLAVKLSSWPEFTSVPRNREALAALHAIRQAVTETK
jgi:CubicO group peptidase (beta-lactamase class C family)